MDSSEGISAYVFGDFRLNVSQRVLTLKADGRVLPLTARVFDTLLYFVQHHGALLDKATLMTAIWPNVIVEENNLNQCISTLRRTLGDSRDEHRFIVTVPNRGYQFVADVSAETGAQTPAVATETIRDDEPPSTAISAVSPVTADAPLARSPTRPLNRSRRFAAAAAGGALILVLGYLLWFRTAPTVPEKTHAPESTSVVVAVPRAVAVLPFADMSSRHDQEYFADGLSEELADRLSRLPGVRVIGRTSSFSFKGKTEDLRTIGKALGVNYLLEGSVRKEGERLRITAHLVDSNGTAVWSNTYDQKLGDVFALQDEVAKSVAAYLTVALTARENDVATGGTRNAEAYDAFLAAKAIAVADSPDDARRGVALLEQAVMLDPGFALAWGELALMYVTANAPERNSAEWNAKGLRATARALELAPEEPRVLAAAAVIATQRKDWEEAERWLKKARERSVGSDNVWEKTGWFLVTVGRPREAAPYMRRAGLAEPLLTFYPAAVSAMYEMSGDLDQAAIELTKSKPLFGNPRFVAINGLLQAMARHDRAQVEQAMSGWPPDALADSMRARLGDPKAALAELRRFAVDPGYPKDSWAQSVLADWAAYFGDPQFSLQLLHDLPKDPSMAFTLWRMVLKDVRRLPGFKDLVRDLGLVDYWRASGEWGQFCRPAGPDDFTCE